MIRLRCSLAFPFSLLLVAVVASGYTDPNKDYRLHSRCWVPYAHDRETLGLFHLDHSADAALEGLEADLLSGPPALEPGAGETMGKTEVSLPEGVQADTVTDAAERPVSTHALQPFEWDLDGARFDGGIHLKGETSAIVTPQYEGLPKGGHFAVEGWFRPNALGGNVFWLPGATPLRVKLDKTGRLVAEWGERRLATPKAVVRAGEWQHLAVTVVPPDGQLRFLYGARGFSSKHGVSARSTGRFTAEHLPHGYQLRLVVNGSIRAQDEADSYRKLAAGLAGSVWIGNDGELSSAFVGAVDEIRVSATGRQYYPNELRAMAATAGPDFPVGRPCVRDAEDERLHQSFEARGTGLPGVHGNSVIGGTEGAKAVAFPEGLSARSGTLEFWFSPHDWDNGKVRYVKEQRRETPPLEMVPVLSLNSRASPGGEEQRILTIEAHGMWPEIGEPDLALRPGRWYHCAVTFDHGRARAWLDGEPMKTRTLVVRTSAPPADHELSRAVFGPWSGWRRKGIVYKNTHNLVDEIRWYSRPLTPPELENLHARFAHPAELQELPPMVTGARFDALHKRWTLDTTLLAEGWRNAASAGWRVGKNAGAILVQAPGRAWAVLDEMSLPAGEHRVHLKWLDEEGAELATGERAFEVSEPPFGVGGAPPPFSMAYYPYTGRIRLVTRPLWERAAVRADFLRTPEGKRGLLASYYDNADASGNPILTRIDPTVDFAWRGSPAHNVPESYFGVIWEGALGPVPATGTYELLISAAHRARLWLDGEAVIDTSEQARGHVIRRNLEKGETYPLKVQYGALAGDPRCHLKWRLLERPEEVPSIRLRVTDEDGREVARTEAAVDPRNEAIGTIDDLPDGKYELHVRMPFGETEFLRWFEREHFEWEHNKLGVTEEVLPPFEPIRVEDRAVNVVMRRYRVGGLGLWESVEARGNDSPAKELLAAPIQLRVNGEPLEGDGRFTSTAAHETVYEGAAPHPAVQVKTRCTTEYDGCMKVELTLEPSAQVSDVRHRKTKSRSSESLNTEHRTLDTLTLDIPLKDDMAPLWHVLKTNIRGNPAGSAPEGEGQIWTSKQFQDGQWPGNFKHYLWSGGEERGLAWFADNERGWVMDWKKQPPCQTLHRRKGVLTLRVHLVQKPVVLEEPRTITFGLMASPAKPMPKDWRAIGRPDDRGIRFSMGHYFGIPATFAGKYPMNKDFSSMDAFYDLRRGKKVDASAFAGDWVERNLDYPDATQELKDAFRNLVRIAVNNGRDRGRFTAYYDEFRATTTFCPEHPTYRCEWDVDNTMLGEIQNFHERYGTKITKPAHWKWYFGSGTMVPSYTDFACYFGAEWLKRSIGLYFDNAFVKTPARNPHMTEAFYREDGQIQPSTQFWAKREYLKRIWVLHQQLRLPETPQIMMIHMTNAHIVPWESFNEVNLDLEWKFGAQPFQRKFSPELLRTESTGLQTGCIPMAISDTKREGATASKVDTQRAERTRWGGFLVHEIRFEWSGQRWPEFLTPFGYGLADCEVFNYWDESPPVDISDSRCKWLLLKRKGRLMLVLCTWRGKESNVTVTLDPERLGGLRPSKVFDVEHPEADEIDRGLGGMIGDFDLDGGGGGDLGMPPGGGMEDKLKRKFKNPNDWQGPVQYDPAAAKATVPLAPYGVRVLQFE